MRDAPETGCALRIASIYVCVWREREVRASMACDFYCCLLSLCEALRPCRWGSAIATEWCCDQDVKAMSGVTTTKGTCDRCGFVVKRGGCCSERATNNRVTMACDLYCCLLLQALQACPRDLRSQHHAVVIFLSFAETLGGYKG